MADAGKIYTGPAQVNLYDSTNKELYLGYNEKIDLSESVQAHTLIDKNNLQYGTLTKIKIPLLQSNPAMLSDIVARRSTKQSLYIVGMEMLTQIDNIYVNVVRDRLFAGGKSQNLILTAQTEVEDDVNDLVNLLGEEGACDTDTNSDNVADGWTNSDMTAGGVTGSGQEVDITGASQTFYYDYICPLDQLPVKISVRADVTELNSDTPTILFGFKTKTNAGVVVDDEMDEFSFTALENRIISKTLSFTPGANVAKIAVYFEDYDADVANFRFKDVMLQFGPLTSYTENV